MHVLNVSGNHKYQTTILFFCWFHPLGFDTLIIRKSQTFVFILTSVFGQTWRNWRWFSSRSNHSFLLHFYLLFNFLFHFDRFWNHCRLFRHLLNNSRVNFSHVICRHVATFTGCLPPRRQFNTFALNLKSYCIATCLSNKYSNEHQTVWLR